MSIDAVSNAGAAAAQRTPPGLARRGLELPPGQADRPESKATPAGITRRFRAAATATEAQPAPAAELDPTAPGATLDTSA